MVSASRAALAAMAFIMTVCAAFAAGGGEVAFKIDSADIRDGDPIPKKFSCDGEDLSPEIRWDGAPDGTKSFALIVDDPDAPVGTFTHWVIYDMPATRKTLERGIGNDPALSGGIKQGKNDFGRTGYGGPCPPKGHGRHRYYFTLRALDVETLGLAAGAKKGDVERTMKGHVLGEARMMGVYQR